MNGPEISHPSGQFLLGMEEYNIEIEYYLDDVDGERSLKVFYITTITLVGSATEWDSLIHVSRTAGPSAVGRAVCRECSILRTMCAQGRTP
jgi:hypothetical protein